MLALTSPFPYGTQPEVDLDAGVPLTLTWPEYHNSPDRPLYYFIKSTDSQIFIEFKFDDQSGRLTELVAIWLKAATLVDAQISLPYLQSAKSLCWSGAPPLDHTEISPTLSVVLYTNGIRIDLAAELPTRWSGVSGICIGTDADERVVSLIAELSPSQAASVRANAPY